MANIPGVGDFSKISGMIDKIGNSLNFPASKDEVVDAVNNAPEMPDQAKNYVQEKLPDKNFNSIDDVKNALGI